MPSAIALVLFALGVEHLGAVDAAWLHGLKIAAVAVVAQAVWGMASTMATGKTRATLAVAAAALVLAVPTTAGQLGAIALGALAGIVLLRSDRPPAPVSHGAEHPPRFCDRLPRACSSPCWSGCRSCRPRFPTRRWRCSTPSIARARWCSAAATSCCRCCRPPWCRRGGSRNNAFLAGYGAAQAVPGPLFTFAAYLGAVMGPAPNGWLGAAIALVAIFLPSFLLVIGVLPFWQVLRGRPFAQSALAGVNAAVVGLLLAALYNPVWTAAIIKPLDFAVALAAFLLLTVWKTPPWLVVLLCAGAGALIG